jgi:hypothetical protein
VLRGIRTLRKSRMVVRMVMPPCCPRLKARTPPKVRERGDPHGRSHLSTTEGPEAACVWQGCRLAPSQSLSGLPDSVTSWNWTLVFLCVCHTSERLVCRLQDPCMCMLVIHTCVCVHTLMLTLCSVTPSLLHSHPIPPGHTSHLLMLTQAYSRTQPCDLCPSGLSGPGVSVPCSPGTSPSPRFS